MSEDSDRERAIERRLVDWFTGQGAVPDNPSGAFGEGPTIDVGDYRTSGFDFVCTVSLGKLAAFLAQEPLP